MPTLREWLEDRILDMSEGYVAGGSPAEEARLTFISDPESVRRLKLMEYRTWYKGDGDELLNLYTKNNTIDYSTEPWFWKNKRSYFWAVSSTESDVKRTHSGLASNIVSTLVGIIGVPEIHAYEEKSEGDKADISEKINEILDGMDFWNTYSETQMPMTMVEGWGCWKTEWDLDFSDEPTVRYYGADDVDFVWRSGRLVGAIFKDWFRGKEVGERYLLTEIRRLVPRRDGKRIRRDLYIENAMWKVTGGDDDASTTITPCGVGDCAEAGNPDETIVITDMDGILARPCIFYKDGSDETMPGRSIFHNKIDLFDDLDQALSQEANTIGKSTPEELFNTDFLERDPHTHMPIMPARYDRKYTTFVGGRDAQGATNTNQPVQVTQPSLSCQMYDVAINQLMSNILSGIMSPATMGISVSVQATAQSQQQKEKVTQFTRSHIIGCETRILQGVCKDLMMASEYLHGGRITHRKFDFEVRYPTFSIATPEEKIVGLFQVYGAGCITPELFVQRVYEDALTGEEREREIQYLIQKKKEQDEMQAQQNQALMMQQAMQSQGGVGGQPPVEALSVLNGEGEQDAGAGDGGSHRAEEPIE